MLHLIPKSTHQPPVEYEHPHVSTANGHKTFFLFIIKSGSSECTVILSVMYHCNVSGRFSSGLRSLPSSAPFLSYP
ncbi:hypothetical protein T03_12841 [Trichinella britovi]|uniref:Uncharacterized protein n=1 Tax=Trichinella britovi TaxID=45882 RepID=A0A0V1C7C7_TRIBR|nr:hypothetical protein T03_12841 [Trichinella britovi]